ncbi:MAG TPA: DUF5818 domain-containing protein [Terriglobales bacterium]|nr:DUF5818 domain-containing protein [Terriglobales bacterium]
MQRTQFALSIMLPMIALMAALCFASQPMLAQSAHDGNTAAQQQPMQPDQNAENAAPEKTFNGKIVKSGDKLVLTDADNKTTYQLDDQQKAQDFLNKSVKVTGVLDAATGTIRVSAIAPV